MPRVTIHQEAVPMSTQAAHRPRLLPQLSEQPLFGATSSASGIVSATRTMAHPTDFSERYLQLPQPAASFFQTLETIERAAAEAWASESARRGGREGHSTAGHSVTNPVFQKDLPIAEDDECTIQLELVSTDGGEYSRDYNCANMLRNDSSCYSSTKQEGVNVVARVVNAPHFTMAEMEAIAPSDGYTSPLGQCCVFVSWDYPDVAAVGEFDLVQDRSHFLQLASRPQQRLPSTPVPVGFLDVSGSFRAKEHLPLARSGVIRTFLVHVN
mmetsp:Transcript_13222/g.37301  ORF Transcript_13222/g.37301 Transcript_13222/m.37301 type:complete len:269 (-) Transcript_13222:586-1392(-)